MFWRLITFGATSGVVWSLAPVVLSELLRPPGQMFSVLAAGILTGVVVTLLLAWPLKWCRGWSAAISGAASLPLGAFLFGIIVSWVHYGLAQWPGVQYRFVQYRFAPLDTGMGYALGVFAFFPWITVVLMPLAIGTTLMQYYFVIRRAECQASEL